MLSLFGARHCKRCVGELADVEKQLQVLKTENQQLHQALAASRALADEVASTPKIAYVASWNRKHFHRQNCVWMENLSQEKMREFVSHEEAVEAGYKPCKTCCA